MLTREQKLNALKEYFAKRDEVLMAFVFGSQARGEAHGSSDWDIAVYFKPETAAVEWEEKNRQYPEEDRIWNDCIGILETDNVDLLILNRAPASIADTAIRGLPLAIKDQRLQLRFMLAVSREAEDYRTFVDEFYAISERSKSLAPHDREDLEKTIKFLDEQISLYPVYCKFSAGEYEREPRKRNEIERWIENIINAAIDISKTVLASEKRLIPSTYRDTVRHAAQSLRLPGGAAEKLESWIKLRNILAHEYLDIKWKRISDFAGSSESFFLSFGKAAKSYLKERP